MSTSVKRQTISGDSGMTKTTGGAHGALHGQLTQQPFGEFGHKGHTGQVGRILSRFSFGAEPFSLVSAFFEQRPQHFLGPCFWPCWVSASCAGREQNDWDDTIASACTFAGPRIAMIPRHTRSDRFSSRSDIYALIWPSCDPNSCQCKRQCEAEESFFHEQTSLGLGLQQHPGSCTHRQARTPAKAPRTGAMR
jgi:hypothetical protein